MARKLVGRSGSTGSHQVIFKGDLTIRSIAQAHARLRDALQAHASLTVGVASDAVADLTFIQLVESARRSARESGKQFSLAASAEGPLRETLERGGFLGANDAARRDFWLMERGGL